MSDLEFTISGTIPATRKEQFLAAILEAIKEPPVPPTPTRDATITEIDFTAQSSASVTFWLASASGDGAFETVTCSNYEGTPSVEISENGGIRTTKVTLNGVPQGEHTLTINHGSATPGVTLPTRTRNAAWIGSSGSSFTRFAFGDRISGAAQQAIKNFVSLTDVVFGANISTDLYMTLCAAIKTIRIYTVTPPNFYPGMTLTALESVEVPAEAVDAYKAATGWSNYASLIQAIPV